MSDIFLSYERQDESRARLVATALEKMGFSVWWDRKILAGKTWSEVIEAAIHNSSVVVALWTHASVKSRWVLKEARRGQREGKLVPARLDEVEPPFEFDDIQAQDLVGWEGDASTESFAQLLEAVRGLIDDPPPPPPPQSPWLRVASVAALAGLALTSVGGLAWILSAPAPSARVSLDDLELDGLRFVVADSVTLEPLSVDWLIVSGPRGQLGGISIRPQEGRMEQLSDVAYLSLEPADESGSIRLVGLGVPSDSAFEVQRTPTEFRLSPPNVGAREITVAGPLSVSTPGGTRVIEFGAAGSILVEDEWGIFFDIPGSGYERVPLLLRADILDLELFNMESPVATVDPTIRAGVMSAPWLDDDLFLAGQRLAFDSFVGAMSSLKLVDDFVATSVEGYEVSEIRRGGREVMPSRFRALGSIQQALTLALTLAYLAGLASVGRHVWKMRSRPFRGLGC